ncbi:hypothetical protein ACFU99_02770 [Streptomyces sp. NPDC057654]|uniref:hypothetical protein n=1 Tax=Streptomyces sp. NPDC057654 TaxID=3346196 RepID=UPI0036A380FF
MHNTASTVRITAAALPPAQVAVTGRTSAAAQCLRHFHGMWHVDPTPTASTGTGIPVIHAELNPYQVHIIEGVVTRHEHEEVRYADTRTLLMHDADGRTYAVQPDRGLAYRADPGRRNLTIVAEHDAALGLAAARLARDVIRAQLQSEGWALLRGAAVADGRALLITGAPGAGTTTAVLYLARAGWQVLSDGHLFVRHDDDGLVRLLPWPASIAVDLPLLDSLGLYDHARRAFRDGPHPDQSDAVNAALRNGARQPLAVGEAVRARLFPAQLDLSTATGGTAAAVLLPHMGGHAPAPQTDPRSAPDAPLGHAGFFTAPPLPSPPGPVRHDGRRPAADRRRPGRTRRPRASPVALRTPARPASHRRPPGQHRRGPDHGQARHHRDGPLMLTATRITAPGTTARVVVGSSHPDIVGWARRYPRPWWDTEPCPCPYPDQSPASEPAVVAHVAPETVAEITRIVAGHPDREVRYTGNGLTVTRDLDGYAYAAQDDGRLAYSIDATRHSLAIAGHEPVPVALAAARLARDMVRTQLVGAGWVLVRASAVERQGRALLIAGRRGADTTAALVLAHARWGRLLSYGRVFVHRDQEGGVRLLPWPAAAAVSLALIDTLDLYDVVRRNFCVGERVHPTQAPRVGDALRAGRHVPERNGTGDELRVHLYPDQLHSWLGLSLAHHGTATGVLTTCLEPDRHTPSAATDHSAPAAFEFITRKGDELYSDFFSLTDGPRGAHVATREALNELPYRSLTFGPNLAHHAAALIAVADALWEAG